MIRNRQGDRSVSISWKKEQLPYFTLWKNTAAIDDGYVTGLEPGTGFPYNRNVERSSGRVPKNWPERIAPLRARIRDPRIQGGGVPIRREDSYDPRDRTAKNVRTSDPIAALTERRLSNPSHPRAFLFRSERFACDGSFRP